MEFLAPLMLIGLAGVALPIIIHLIGRRRARRVRFAAIDFLLGSDRKVKRRLRLREILLLVARILACLAVPLALAKPFTACEARGPMVARGPQAAVLVIDNSFASTFAEDGESLIARSKDRARRILDQLGPEAEVAVVATSEGGDPPTELSRDHLRLRDRIRATEATARPADVTGALRRAGQLVSGSSQSSRTVYFLGVPTAAAVRPGESPWPAGQAPLLRVVDPAGGRDLHNVALTGIAVDPDPDSGARGIRVTAEIANFGGAAVRDRAAALRIDGRVVARGLVSVEAGQRVSKRFTASLPAGTRAAEISVELATDGLAMDDRRFALAELRAEIPILLVDGDPRTVRYEDEVFYAAAALRPGDRSDSGAVLTVTTPDELGDRELDEFAVVVLANVAALDRAQSARLRKWVEGGGGLFISVGSNVAVEAYNERMAALLPQSLSGISDLTHGARGGEKSGRALRLAKLELEHPIFAVFPPDAPGLAEATFSRVVLLGPTTGIGSRRVLARYDNGTAAMIEATVGEGRVLLYTSTLDRDWNDLPIHPGFVPLLQQTMRHLAGLSPRDTARQLLAGQPLLLDVATDTARIEVNGPSDRTSVIEGEALADRRQVRFDGTDEPGFYRVTTVSREADAGEARQAATFAINVDAAGSDLRRVDLDAALGSAPQPQAIASAGPHRRRVELWHAVAAALLLFLLIESVLVWKR